MSTWSSLVKRLGLRAGAGKRRRLALRDRYPQYAIGRHTYGDLRVHQWGEGKSLTIGSFCSLADGVRIYLGGEHRIDWVTTFPFNVKWKDAAEFTGHPASKGDVVIGNDVWIGADALILSGVTIGDGAVIGARAVVAKDVPPYAIAVGNPATVVRRRFEAEIVEALLRIRWWDWEDARIRKALPLLLSDNVAAFVRAAQGGAI